MEKDMSGFSTRAMGYSSAGLSLLILSFVLSSELLLLGSFLFFALLLLSLSFIPPRPSIKREMERKEMFEGETSESMISVRGRARLGNLEVFDPLSPRLTLKGSSNVSLMTPGPGSFRYEIRAPLRGYHKVGPTRIRRWDPLWLWYRETEADNEDRLTVFPTMLPGRSGGMMIKRFRHRPGEMKLKRVGAGKEFHSIRDYTPTDPFNTINWKAYARTGTLLVNQYEAESVTDVIFLIDARMVTRVGTMVENPLERGIRLCASLSSHLLTGSNRVGMIIYGSSAVVHRPMGGQVAMNRILHTLADVTPAGYNTMGATVSYSLPYLTPHAPIILISPLSEDPTIKEAVKQLIGRGHDLTIVSPAGIEFERMVYDGVVTPKYLLKRLNRENLINDLRSMGSRVIDWTPDKDLAWAVEEVWK